MTETFFNLLDDPLIEIAEGSPPSTFVNLPTVLAKLGGNADLEFPGLQAHHGHPWHAFLVQLAAIALNLEGREDPDLPAEAWRKLLQNLVKDESAWCLVVDDLKRPAFLQPPITKEPLTKLKNMTLHPDKLDILVTAKNHEIKAESVATETALDAARRILPILLTFQTFSGFSGRGNYGVMRMNGGFSSRPAVCISPDLRWATRFRRDLSILLEQREVIIDEIGFAENEAAAADKDRVDALLWQLEWHGKPEEALKISDLDPYCIEVCRRVRLTLEEDQIRLHFGSTDAARINAKDKFGHVGDPWTPIRESDPPTALTVSESGFNYRLVSDLLFRPEKTYQQPPTQVLRPEEPADMIAIFMTLVRGQGKTGGYHERFVTIPSSKGRIFDPEADRLRYQLAQQSQGRIQQVKDVQRRVLKPALLALLQGGTQQKPNLKDDRAQSWLSRFDQEVDRIFFPLLFSDDDPEKADITWQEQLWKLAQGLFEEATEVLPKHAARKQISIAQAESLFRFKAREVLPFAFPKPKQQEDTAA